MPSLLHSDSASSIADSSERSSTPSEAPFDIAAHYKQFLEEHENIAMPVAAVECLAEVVSRSLASTFAELTETLDDAIIALKASSLNPISLTAGCDLFMRFLTTVETPPGSTLPTFCRILVTQAREFVRSSHAFVTRSAEAATGFITDGSTILVHGYSRPVTQALLAAASMEKKRFQVFVTESRPFGLGIRTHAVLKAHGIPCCVVIDSAVAYTMAKCDMVFVGAEGVVENGGLINMIGGYQIALVAKAHGKPLYALAESYKFLRLFPLSQFDLPTGFPSLRFPTDLPSGPFCPSSLHVKTLPSPSSSSVPHLTRPMKDSAMPDPLPLTAEMISNNPLLDYTTPDLIHLIISDVGVLTPPGVADQLLKVYGGS